MTKVEEKAIASLKAQGSLGAIHCPHCGVKASYVIEVRSSNSGRENRRRRGCANCRGKFTTYEQIQKSEDGLLYYPHLSTAQMDSLVRSHHALLPKPKRVELAGQGKRDNEIQLTLCS